MLRLFAEAGLRAGDRLSLVDIGDRWGDTGFRTSDLSDAVQALIDSGDLVAMMQDGQPGYGLSQNAYRDLLRPDCELQRASIEDNDLLFELRCRPRRGRDSGQRRRAEDMAEVK
jgi:hypothetical protein